MIGYKENKMKDINENVVLKPLGENLEKIAASAEKGRADAMLKLGKHFLHKMLMAEEDGRGDAFISALYWLSKAAQRKKWEACFWLGIALEIFCKGNCRDEESVERMQRDIECDVESNPVWQDIVRRLEDDGYDEIMTKYDDEDVYKNQAAALVIWSFDVFASYREDLADLDSLYFQTAALHGISKAKARYGSRLKHTWDTWQDILKNTPKEEMLTTILLKGEDVFSIMKYYKDARFWLLDSLNDGEDMAISDLYELLKGKKYDFDEAEDMNL